MRTGKGQSAIEYLLTYGWLLLIIVIIIGVLFQLGVFNSGTYATRTAPGACQIYRSTTGPPSLGGVCFGVLPEFVTTLPSANLGAGGVLPSSYPTGMILAKTQELDSAFVTGNWTINFWFNQIKPTASGPASQNYQPIALFLKSTYSIPAIGIQDLYWDGGGTSSSLYQIKPFIYSTTPNDYAMFTGNFINAQYGQWVMISLTFDYNAISQTATGLLCNDATCNSLTQNMAGPPYYGSSPPIYNTPNDIYNISVGGYGFPFVANGNFPGASISNLQIYNVTLTGAQIKELYTEGLGGAPIYLQRIVGWWPLNNNPNDYSGYQNNGQLTGVITYNNSWTNQYTPP